MTRHGPYAGTSLKQNGSSEMELTEAVRRYAEPRPYTDPEKAARRIMEIASTVEPVQAPSVQGQG